jgi:predicted transcriptional regulator
MLMAMGKKKEGGIRKDYESGSRKPVRRGAGDSGSASVRDTIENSKRAKKHSEQPVVSNKKPSTKSTRTVKIDHDVWDRLEHAKAQVVASTRKAMDMHEFVEQALIDHFDLYETAPKVDTIDLPDALIERLYYIARERSKDDEYEWTIGALIYEAVSEYFKNEVKKRSTKRKGRARKDTAHSNSVSHGTSYKSG